MQARADSTRPDMQYRCMDARRITLEAGTVDVILDKGCLDCVLCDADPKVKVGQMLGHMSRVRSPHSLFVSPTTYIRVGQSNCDVVNVVRQPVH
jgi:hypothetical protein